MKGTEPVGLAGASEADDLWREARGTTLLEMVATPGTRYPGLPAVFFSRDGATREALTWGALWEGSLAVAERLMADGLEPGSPAIVAAPTSPTFFTAFFGILTAGGVPVPVAPPVSKRPSRLEWYVAMLTGIVADAGVRFVVTSSSIEGTLAECAQRVSSTLTIVSADTTISRGVAPRRQVAICEARRADPNDLALLQYTSGSTGQPKGVALTHANVIANVSLIADAIVTRESSAVSWLPLHHDMGLIGAALTALYTRRPVVLLSPQAFARDPGVWLRAIGTFRPTITLAPNFAFAHTVRSVKADDVAGVSLDSLRTVLNGAEPVDVDAIDAFETTFGSLGLARRIIRPVYGLAETALAVTFSEEGDRVVDEVDADALERAGLAAPVGTPGDTVATDGPGVRAVRDRLPVPRIRRLVSVGRPLPTQQLRIVDAQDREQPDRVVGEVVVRGPSVMRGYFNRPAETSIALRSGWLHTGDRGYLSDGRLFLTGRVTDLIIRHGRNYDPGDVEAIVARTDGAAIGGVAAFTADTAGASHVVVLVETRLRRPEDLSALTRRIRESCHNAFHFGPDDLRLVPQGAIPRTTSGKVRRGECRRLYLERALAAIAGDGGG